MRVINSFKIKLKKEIIKVLSDGFYCPNKRNSINLKADDYLSQYVNNNYDFSSAAMGIIRINGKKRLIKHYPQDSTERVLCSCVKQLLDEELGIFYPNRSRICRKIFSLLPAVIQMQDFTIIKFDFRNYYNSLSSVYIFDKYVKNRLQNRDELIFIEKYCHDIQKAFAGLPPSNALAEVIGREFDKEIINGFLKYNLLMFERYVDDCILILGSEIREDRSKSIITDAITKVFNGSCKKNNNNNNHVRINWGKWNYVSKSRLTGTISSFDFLGYEFYLSKTKDGNVSIKYGITEQKRNKYRKQLKKIIFDYFSSNDSNSNIAITILQHRLVSFISRRVFCSRYYTNPIWEAQGFIHVYGELRHIVGTSYIESKTDGFIKHIIKQEILNAQKVFSSDKCKNIHKAYNLEQALKRNKSLLFVKNIGYDYSSLIRKCERVGLSTKDKNGKANGYNYLVQQYLSLMND